MSNPLQEIHQLFTQSLLKGNHLQALKASARYVQTLYDRLYDESHLPSHSDEWAGIDLDDLPAFVALGLLMKGFHPYSSQPRHIRQSQWWEICQQAATLLSRYPNRQALITHIQNQREERTLLQAHVEICFSALRSQDPVLIQEALQVSHSNRNLKASLHIELAHLNAQEDLKGALAVWRELSEDAQSVANNAYELARLQYHLATIMIQRGQEDRASDLMSSAQSQHQAALRIYRAGYHGDRQQAQALIDEMALTGQEDSLWQSALAIAPFYPDLADRIRGQIRTTRDDSRALDLQNALAIVRAKENPKEAPTLIQTIEPDFLQIEAIMEVLSLCEDEEIVHQLIDLFEPTPVAAASALEPYEEMDAITRYEALYRIGQKSGLDFTEKRHALIKMLHPANGAPHFDHHAKVLFYKEQIKEATSQNQAAKGAGLMVYEGILVVVDG